MLARTEVTTELRDKNIHRSGKALSQDSLNFLLPAAHVRSSHLLWGNLLVELLPRPSSYSNELSAYTSSQSFSASLPLHGLVVRGVLPKVVSRSKHF